MPPSDGRAHPARTERARETDARTRSAFVERGSEALRVRSGAMLTSYYEVPADVLDDEDELLRWARRALLVAEAEPERPRRRTRTMAERDGRGAQRTPRQGRPAKKAASKGRATR